MHPPYARTRKSPRRGWSWIVAGLLVYALLAALTVRDVGLVGEVAAGWALPRPPTVILDFDATTRTTAEHRIGPLVARQTRPTEILEIGDLQVPLAINAYTGGPPDWPARTVRALTGSLAAGSATPVALGGILIVLTARFLRFHGTDAAARVAPLVLATDWSFVFYKKVLGGTEVLLQAAGLLLLWSLWSRRWKGGTHGTLAIAVAVGLGLLAKATFACTLFAFGVAAVLTRWDRSAMGAPRRVRPVVVTGVVLALLGPLLVAAAHHAVLPEDPRVVSHDTLRLQLGRLFDVTTMGRESTLNLARWLTSPLPFFHDAYKAAIVDEPGWLRLPTHLATLAGVVLAWRDRAASPAGALLRFLGLAVPLQLGALFLANHDLHHLAQATLPLVLLTVLGADRLAAALAPRGSALRLALTLAFVAPSGIAGARLLDLTDPVVRSSGVSSFTRGGQAAIVAMLRAHDVRRVALADYELCGVVEALAPEIEVVNAWGAMSRHAGDPRQLVATSDWFLAVRPSAPFIYDWAPTDIPGAVRVDAISAVGVDQAVLWRDPARIVPKSAR